MKANIVLAMLILFFAVLPLVYALSPSEIFNSPSYYTDLASPGNGKRRSSPVFWTVGNTIYASYTVELGSRGMTDTQLLATSNDGKTWTTGIPVSITGGESRSSLLAEYPFFALKDPTRSTSMIGMDLLQTYSGSVYYGKIELLFSDNGRDWHVIGLMPQVFPYQLANQGAILTSDGVLMFAACGSGSSLVFSSWVYYCHHGDDPRVMANWHTGQVFGGSNYDEPSIVEVAPQGTGHFLMIGRGGWEAVGTNYGETLQSAGRSITCPTAPVALVRYSWSPSRILLCWDEASGTTRNPLNLAVSEDEGLSWGSNHMLIQTGGVANCYPNLVLAPNNRDVVVGWWVTDITGGGGSGQGEVTRACVVTAIGGVTNYDVTVNAYCNNRSVVLNVKIYLDGSDTGKTTPNTLTGLSDTHFIQVEDIDAHGHPFGYWDNPPLFAVLALSDSMTVSSAGTHTAYYDVTVTPVLSWPFMVLFGVGAVALIGGLYVTRWRLHLPTRRKRR